MRRAIDQLANQSFDVIVVGGGIYGASLAFEAAHQGYEVALIEGNDFCSGTSANSLKVLHGGLRYLQHLNLKRMRESIRSRQFYLQLAPNLVDIMPFLIPLSGQGMKGPAAMQAGLLAYSQIAIGSNRGVNADKRLPKGYIVPKNRLADEINHLGRHDYSGGGVWYEAVANNTERLVLTLVKAAYRSGAVVANYVRAKQITQQYGQITGIQAHDTINDLDLHIQARWVIDASGRGVGQLKSTLTGEPPQLTPCARANNVIINRPLFQEKAVGLPVIDNLKDSRSIAKRDNRMLFFVPWQDKTMVGTFYQAEQQVDGRLIPSRAEKATILAEINRAWPGPALTEYDICHWHSGWLPMKPGSYGDNIELADDATINTHLLTQNEPQIMAHQPPSGLVEVRGVKFATAPEVAKQAIQNLSQHLQPIRSSGTKSPNQHGPARLPFDAIDAPKFPIERHLYNRYGRDWEKVKAFMESCPEDLERIGDKTVVAEVRYIARYEMAYRLSDVIWRRLPIGECGVDFDSNVAKCAKIMQQERGWSDEWLQHEIKNVMTNQFRS